MREKKTRRRGAVLEQAILDAAWIELREGGWAGFTIEGVAARSGAAKTVIYRRWRNRAELVQHMLNEAARSQPDLPSSGYLRADLVALLGAISEFLRGPFGQAIRGSMSEGDFASTPSVFGERAVILGLQKLVEQAVDRGELSRSPAPLAVNLGHSVVMWEFLATGAPPGHGDIESLVDAAWLPALRRTD